MKSGDEVLESGKAKERHATMVPFFFFFLEDEKLQGRVLEVM
jgi:hypothetical protein